MKLTDATVRALPHPQSGQRDYVDDTLSGFSVRIGKRAKTFMLTLGTGAKRKRYSIGRYNPPHFTLSMAREKAKDVAAKHRLEPEISKATTFEAAVKTFFATHELKNRVSTRKEHQRLFDRHWLPVFEKRKLVSIKTGEIVAELDDLLETPSEANHAFVILRTFLNWARRRKLITHSPVEGLDKPAPESSRDRVLSKDELRVIWFALDTIGGRYAPLVKLLMLTAQRRKQFTHMDGKFIDRDAYVITWPPGMMKIAREHTIPYGSMAEKLLDTLPEIGLLFPTNAGTPDQNSGNYKIKLDKVCPVEDWTYHDFRRTFATVCANELDIEPHIIEAILAHSFGTKTARIYNRAKYIVKMRIAINAYENWLQAVLSNPEGTNARYNSRVDQKRTDAVIRPSIS